MLINYQKLKKCSMKNKSSKIVFLFALLFFAVMGSPLNGFKYGQASAQGISDTNSTGGTNSTQWHQVRDQWHQWSEWLLLK